MLWRQSVHPADNTKVSAEFKRRGPMKQNGRKCLAFLLAVMLVVPMVGKGQASAKTLEEIQQEKQENQIHQDETKKQKDDAQKVVDELQNQADDLGAAYNSYNQRLQSVNSEISEIQGDIASTTKSISQLEKQLEKARSDQESQYEGMKARIRFMYENGTDSMLVSLLECGSMAEFLKRAEYIAAITSYDREMVTAYAQLQKSIKEKSASLSDKKSKLSQYNETLTAKQGELDELVMNAKGAYSAKQGEVSAAEMTVEQFNAKIEEYRQQEASLAGEEAAAQAQLAQQIAQQQQQQQQQQQGDGTGEEENGGETPAPSEDTSGALNGYTDADLKLMASIIQAEAGGESYEGQLAVGTVIMNRVKSSYFPNTLSGVIYQDNQFQPVRDGHLALILERGPNESCTNAARQVLNGYRSGDWLFFMTQVWADHFGITGYTMIGNHAFFTRWGAN